MTVLPEPCDELEDRELVLRRRQVTTACGPFGKHLMVAVPAFWRPVLAEIDPPAIELDERQVSRLASRAPILGLATASTTSAFSTSSAIFHGEQRPPDRKRAQCTFWSWAWCCSARRRVALSAGFIECYNGGRWQIRTADFYRVNRTCPPRAKPQPVAPMVHREAAIRKSYAWIRLITPESVS